MNTIQTMILVTLSAMTSLTHAIQLEATASYGVTYEYWNKADACNYQILPGFWYDWVIPEWHDEEKLGMKNFVGHYCSKRDFRPADGCNCYEDDWDQLSKSDVKKYRKFKEA